MEASDTYIAVSLINQKLKTLNPKLFLNRHRTHILEQFLVALGAADLIEKEFHGFGGSHRVHDAPEHPDTVQFGIG